MKSWSNKNIKPFTQALIIFSILFCLVTILVLYYDFSVASLKGFLFIFAFLCCVFVAKNTFDEAYATQVTGEMKEGLATDLRISSEELYIQLYKNSPVPYMIVDFEGQVKSANVAAVRMLGVSQSKVQGVNVFKQLQCDSVEHLEFLIEKYHSGVPVSGETVRVKRSDQNEVWALLSLFGFLSGSGKKIGLLTLVDITKQKKAEDAKSEFVSLASHQLRTPIAGMKWSAELLLFDSPDNLNERQRKYIDRLLMSVNRMAVLVNDFLRVSRFELGTFKAEYSVVDLSGLFHDVMSELSSRVAQKKLTVKTFFDESINNIISDQNLLRMIVTNLYSNATKYTREGGTIHVGFARKNNDISITVADNGMGIPVKDQDEIFTKLFRAENAIRDVPDGTGLGLYIVREAVTVLKGSVTFTTMENVGTTFEVVLPLELASGKEVKN